MGHRQIAGPAEPPSGEQPKYRLGVTFVAYFIFGYLCEIAFIYRHQRWTPVGTGWCLAAGAVMAVGFTTLRYQLARFYANRGRWTLSALLLVTFVTAYTWQTIMIWLFLLALCAGYLIDQVLPLPDRWPRNFREIREAWNKLLG
jgi:hypothetical protein